MWQLTGAQSDLMYQASHGGTGDHHSGGRGCKSRLSLHPKRYPQLLEKRYQSMSRRQKYVLGSLTAGASAFLPAYGQTATETRAIRRFQEARQNSYRRLLLIAAGKRPSWSPRMPRRKYQEMRRLCQDIQTKGGSIGV